MSTKISLSTPSTLSGLQYETLSLYELCLLIPTHGTDVLEEIINNRKILNPDRMEWCYVQDYLAYLSQKDQERNIEHTDEILEKVWQRITHFPEPPFLTPAGKKRKQVDCRKFYKAYVSYLSKELKKKPNLSPLEKEALVTSAFQRQLKRHYEFVKKDVKIKNLPYTRYKWKINEGIIALWMPRQIRGRDRARFLERNIPDPDPFRPGEQKRIQKIIDSVSLDYLNRAIYQSKFNQMNTQNLNRLTINVLVRLICEKGVDHAVAQEKSHPIIQKKLRPTIRNMESSRLFNFILEYFDDLMNDCLVMKTLADKYGLTYPTFNRFCGLKWIKQTSKNGKNGISDLWKNTIQVLSNIPELYKICNDFLSEI